LATIISAWGIASLFCPYLSDQQIDWAAELPRALSDAAAATSAKQYKRIADGAGSLCRSSS
jgi:hypothetical protein